MAKKSKNVEVKEVEAQEVEAPVTPTEVTYNFTRDNFVVKAKTLEEAEEALKEFLKNKENK